MNRGVVGGFRGLELRVAFDELVALEARPGADVRDDRGASRAHQRSWAASISLNAMAIPVALGPGLTVAKVNSKGSDLP